MNNTLAYYLTGIVLFWATGASANTLPTIEAELKQAEERLANENAFRDRIQKRINTAREALDIGKKRAESQLNEAHVHFEAASKIAQAGLALADAQIPAPPADEAFTFWTTASAAAAVGRLEKAVEAYRDQGEFTIRYHNNEYQKEIANLEAKLKAYVERNINPLEHQVLNLRKASQAGLAIVGVWQDSRTIGWRRFEFRRDGNGSGAEQEVRAVYDGPNRQGRWVPTGNVRTWTFSWSFSDDGVSLASPGSSSQLRLSDGDLFVGNRRFKKR
jgi:hypothetical protein